MKTAFSDVEYAKKVAALQQQALNVNPPAIPFKRKKSKRDDDDDDSKDRVKTVKIRLDPEDEDSDQLEVKIKVFEDGDSEDWVKWRIAMDEAIRDIPLDDGDKKIKLAKSLLKGVARERFTMQLTNLEMAANADDEDSDDERDLNDRNVIYQLAIEELGRFYFPTDHAWRRQRNYMRYHLFMVEGTLMEFKSRVLELSGYLPYFPPPEGREEAKGLDEDEIVEIIDRGKRIEWQRDVLTANIDPYGMTLDEYCKYLEKLEVKHRLDKAL